MIARRARITGLVQGVGFRESTRRRAVAAGVGGWVRNEADGGVVVLLAGEPAAVEQVLAFLRDGPVHASVDTVDVEEVVPAQGDLDRFEIR